MAIFTRMMQGGTRACARSRCRSDKGATLTRAACRQEDRLEEEGFAERVLCHVGSRLQAKGSPTARVLAFGGGEGPIASAANASSLPSGHPLLTVWRLCRPPHWLPRGWKSLPVNIGLSMGKDTRWRCLLPLYRNVSTSLQLQALSYVLPVRCTSRRWRFGSTLLPIRLACELFVSPTVLSARPRVVDKFV